MAFKTNSFVEYIAKFSRTCRIWIINVDQSNSDCENNRGRVRYCLAHKQTKSAI